MLINMKSWIKDGIHQSEQPFLTGIRGPSLVPPFWQRRGYDGGPIGQGPLLVGEGRRLVVRHAQGTDGP